MGVTIGDEVASEPSAHDDFQRPMWNLQNMPRNLTVATIFAVAACSGSQPVQELSDRVAAPLSHRESCAHIASVQYLSDSVLVRIPDAALFKTNQTKLTECGQFVLTSLIQSMLDPRMMRVAIEQANLSPAFSSLSRERAEVLKTTFSHVGFAADQPPVVLDPASKESAGAWGIRLAVATPMLPVATPTTVTLFDGSYRVTLHVTGTATAAKGQDWCDSPGQPVITITNGQLTFLVPHPNVPGNPTLSLVASVYQDGSLSGQSNDGGISGQISGRRITGRIDGAGCVYGFSGGRI